MAKNYLKKYMCVCVLTLAWSTWYDLHHKLSLQPKITSHEPKQITDTYTSEVTIAWIIEQVSAPLLGMHKMGAWQQHLFFQHIPYTKGNIFIAAQEMWWNNVHYFPRFHPTSSPIKYKNAPFFLFDKITGISTRQSKFWLIRHHRENKEIWGLCLISVNMEVSRLSWK